MEQGNKLVTAEQGLPKSMSEVGLQITCLNKEGGRSLHLEPGHENRKLENQKVRD